MTQGITVCIAQLNLTVGAIEANVEQMLLAAERAVESDGADIVVFPELALTGYPPEDLLLRPSLTHRVETAIQRLCDAALPAALVFGFPQQEGGELFNALGVVENGILNKAYRKQCLPNYQVFDERRYFSPGTQAGVLEIRGKVFGLAICEDLWEDGPSEKLAAANIEAVISLNASPFHKGKLAERRALLTRRAKQLGVPLIYANLIGGQDELVFDGGSFAVDGTGEVVIQLPQFEEAAASLSIAEDGRVVPRQLEHTPQLSVPAQVYSALVLGVRDYVQKNGFKSVVLGLSGGIDSALTLAIAVDALGSEAVNAVMMPYEYTSQLSLEAAAEQAATLGVAYRSIPIKEMVESFSVALAGEFDGYAADVTEQNLQARCRGVLLMAISNKKGHLVLTTGNKSEIAVGYSTLYGDMAGGFDVLKDVSKGLVHQLSRYRNETHKQAGLEGEAIPVAVIERPPSAELAPGQLDQDNLPDYDTLDKILELYIEQDVSAQGIIAAGFDENQVKRVLRLVDVNEYKRRQSAIGPRITPRGFGRDRRYPITNGWTIGD